MLNLIRLGNKTASESFASIRVNASSIKLNTVACTTIGAVPGKSRIDVGVDGVGNGAEIYIAVMNDKADEKAGRILTEASTLNASAIKAALQQFKTEVFEITSETIPFDNQTWYKVKPVYEEKVEVPTETKKTKSSAIAETVAE